MTREPPRRWSRRTFLARSATTAAALGCPAILAAGGGEGAPSERITIGCIGMGNHGIRRNDPDSGIPPQALALKPSTNARDKPIR